jgi:hypothetical protein
MCADKLLDYLRWRQVSPQTLDGVIHAADILDG